MSFRLLSRSGIGLGARLVGKNKNVAKVTRVAGAERNVSSVGLGQDHFRRPYTSRPGKRLAGCSVELVERTSSMIVSLSNREASENEPYAASVCIREGSLGAGTQLFKLVETDLMSRELTRYGPSDAEHLGLYSVQDVLSGIAHATPSSPPNPEKTLHTSSVAPALNTATAPQEKPMSSEAAAARGEKILAAWGMGQGTVEVTEDVKADEEADESVPERTEAVPEKLAIKRTYQPSTLKRKRMHGFLYRAKTRLGKKIMRRRQEKGRWRLGI